MTLQSLQYHLNKFVGIELLLSVATNCLRLESAPLTTRFSKLVLNELKSSEG